MANCAKFNAAPGPHPQMVGAEGFISRAAEVGFLEAPVGIGIGPGEGDGFALIFHGAAPLFSNI